MGFIRLGQKMCVCVLAVLWESANNCICFSRIQQAAIAQLGERQTEDLKVPGSIPGLGMVSSCRSLLCSLQPLISDITGSAAEV